MCGQDELHAWTVLKDCERALCLLEREDDPENWRVIWAGAMALIRTVGHVIIKVDCRDGIRRKVAQDLWRKWKGEAIFRNFIDKERNLILKEYSTNVLVLHEHRFVVSDCDEDQLFDLEGGLWRSWYCPEVTGETEEDVRDVYRRSIIWWKTKLQDLEAALQNR